MRIFKSSKAEEVLKKATQELNEILNDRKGRPTLLLLSGGSSLNLLAGIDTKNLDTHLTITVLDERFSADPKVNTFSQIQKTSFYKAAQGARCFFIDTRMQEDESLDYFAFRFEDDLKKWKKKYPEGMIIITQGIGLDGHTAGIMPHPENLELFNELFEKKNQWIVGYDVTLAKNPYPKRATTTLFFLRNLVDISVVYAFGEDKKEALKKVFALRGSLAEIPARIIHDMRNVRLFCSHF